MKPTISIQGGIGSFHDVVASAIWPEKKLLEREPFFDVFTDVKEGRADYGLVAIENSVAGAILQNFDMLRDFGVKVVGEYYLRIKHNLITKPNEHLEDISEVWSHPMALKQCRKFLQRHMGIKAVEKPDTAMSVRDIKEGDLLGVAAIASSRAAEVYDMKILAEGIEDDPNNYTRFLVLKPQDDESQIQLPIKLQNGSSTEYKTSLYIELAHEPGGLLTALEIFRDRKLNLTMLVSRPIVGKAWEYGFYLDFTHKGSDVAETLKALKDVTSRVQVLGTYPANITSEKS